MDKSFRKSKNARRSKEKKKEFAEKNKILIDDLKSNIKEWKASSGIGILLTNKRFNNFST